MADIVERLRDLVGGQSWGYDHDRPASSYIENEAADEIERLREALERIQWYSHDQPAALNVSREEWEARRARSMQQIARAALKGEGDG